MPFGPLATAGGGGGAPDDAQYVVMVANATLTQERVLTGTANQVTIADGGAGAAVTLALPQDYDAAATPTLGGLTLNGALLVHSQNEVRWYDNGNYVGFEAGALGADQIWVLPTADGGVNEFLQTDGGGNLTWAAAGGGGAPGGANKQVQYNNAAAFGGAIGFEWQNASPNVIVNAQNAAHVPFVVKGIAAQAGNLQEWQDSAGGVQTAMDYAAAFAGTSGFQLTINSTQDNVGDTSGVLFDYKHVGGLAGISAVVEGAGDVGLALYTATGGGGTQLEHVRIDDEGNVGIGTTTPGSGSDGKLRVVGTISGDSEMLVTDQAVHVAPGNVGFGINVAGNKFTKLIAGTVGSGFLYDESGFFYIMGISAFGASGIYENPHLAMDGDGKTLVGSDSVAPVFSASMLEIRNSTTTRVGLMVKGIAAQTAALFQLQDSTTGVVVDSGDGLAGSEFVFNQGGIDIDFRVESLTYDAITVDAATDGLKLMDNAAGLIGFFGAAPVDQLNKADYNNWVAFTDVVDALVAIGLFDAA